MTEFAEVPLRHSEAGGWRNLQVRLTRCYQGSVAGRSGRFLGNVLTIWKLIRGSVQVEKEGVRLAARSADGVWMVGTPGERNQRFSGDAEILSLHFSVESSGNGAEWRGRPFVLIKPDAGAVRALAKVTGCAAIRSLSAAQSLQLSRLDFSLEDQLELQERTVGLFRSLLRLLPAAGLDYGPPLIADSRVRASHRRLAGLSIQAGFSREEFAAEYGLTAGQLERLWRHELGATPSQYRDRQRSLYAREQLWRSDVSVKAIAAELGFRHLSQFSNWFRARHGVSPRNYRAAGKTSV